jgi:hypothetical protein
MLAGVLHDISALSQLEPDPGFSPVPFLFLGWIALFGLIPFALRRRRVRRLERLAGERGFDVLDRELPADFQTRLTGLDRWDTVSTAIAGFEGGDMLVAFDIEMPHGRTTYLRTIVARRCSRPVHALEKAPAGCSLRTWDNWRAVMLSRDFGPVTISPQRIEQLWEALS